MSLGGLSLFPANGDDADSPSEMPMPCFMRPKPLGGVLGVYSHNGQRTHTSLDRVTAVPVYLAIPKESQATRCAAQAADAPCSSHTM